MAATIAIVEANGLKLKVKVGDRSYGSRPHKISVTIFGEQIQFGITEKVRKLRIPEPASSLDPPARPSSLRIMNPAANSQSRVFSFSSYFTTTWRDTEETKIESLIPQCVGTMIKIAIEHRRSTARRRQEELFQKFRGRNSNSLKHKSRPKRLVFSGWKIAQTAIAPDEYETTCSRCLSAGKIRGRNSAPKPSLVDGQSGRYNRVAASIHRWKALPQCWIGNGNWKAGRLTAGDKRIWLSLNLAMRRTE